MATIHVYNHTNYYNRQIIKYNDINDYGVPLYTIGGVNFNPNDGVNTTILLGTNRYPYGGNGNYLIVSDSDGIDSRWYIIEHKRQLIGQWQLTIHRDLISDYMDVISDSPMFIEKATLNDDDPFIYNGENMTFNQIKKSETMLKDFTGCPWIVGYFARSDSGTESVSKSYSGNIVTGYTADIVVRDSNGNIGELSEWEWYDYISNEFIYYPTNLYFITKVKGVLTAGTTYSNWTISDSSNNGSAASTSDNKSWIYYGDEWNNAGKSVHTVATYWNKKNYYHKTNGMYDLVNHHLTNSTTESYWNSKAKGVSYSNLDGKVIAYKYNGNIIYKKIRLDTNVSITTHTVDPLTTYGGGLAAQWTVNMENAGLSVGTPVSNVYIYSYRLETRVSKLELIDSNIDTSSSTASVTIPSERVHTKDASYDMFCMPYSNDFKLLAKVDGSYQYLSIEKSTAIGIATGLATNVFVNGVGCYDLQLLPYCPVSTLVKTELGFGFEDQDYADKYGYTLIKNANGSVIGFIIYSDMSSFTLDISLDEPIIIKNPKVENLTDIYRLCSPNYQGVFEFSAAKNGGVSKFNVDCTYAPINPYIHINPDFNGDYLYGMDFDDSRGLICQGDFSLSNYTSEWAQYQMNNKNYEAAFNRQIESLDLQNKIQKYQDIFGAVSGATSGSVSGAIAGAQVGGPFGAVIGGISGGAISSVAGVADVYFNDLLRNDALDLTKDQFAYNLGNVQARPQSIAKTSAYTYNNKIFPFLEFYTCTEEEKEALKDKLLYNGMTVMRIGTIAEFRKSYPTYIKGKLIRCEDIGDDYHLLVSIADELYKGVYI